MRTLWIGLAIVALVGVVSVATAEQIVPVFLVNLDGSIDGTTTLARAWAQDPYYPPYCNKDHAIDVAVAASVAQWSHVSLEATNIKWRIQKPFWTGDWAPGAPPGADTTHTGYAIDGIGVFLRSNGDLLVDYRNFADLENAEGDVIPT